MEIWDSKLFDSDFLCIIAIIEMIRLDLCLAVFMFGH